MLCPAVLRCEKDPLWNVAGRARCWPPNSSAGMLKVFSLAGRQLVHVAGRASMSARPARRRHFKTYPFRDGFLRTESYNAEPAEVVGNAPEVRPWKVATKPPSLGETKSGQRAVILTPMPSSACPPSLAPANAVF